MKDKETSEAAVVADEAVAGGGHAAVVATKIKRASKSKSGASTLNTASTETVIPAPLLATTQLRPYQQECIDKCLENLKNGIMRQIVSLPVGSGKTVIFSHLMEQVPAPFPGANKTLILAHRQELLEQTRNHILRNGTGLRVTIDQGKRVADMTADVILASVPTLGRSGTTRILKYNPQDFKCIIIDEAHHAAADSYGRILRHFGADVPKTHIFLYGCSATVRRHDGLKLGGVFDYISFHKGFITMIDDKWLCGLRVSTIKTEFDLKDVQTRGGDFVTKDLALKVNTPVRNDVVVRSYMTYCGERKSTVVFAVDIAHLESLAETFRKYGYDARGLSSKTNDDERARMLKDFKNQKFPVIVNCGILTEGTDIPVIDAIIMARPTKSNVLFQQMLGRGMRLHPGKEDCLVLDFVDVVRGDGLVTLPTLLGLETDSVLNDEKIATLEEQAASSEFPDETETVEEIDPSTGLKVARIRVLEYENPYQLIGDCSGANRRVSAMSGNAWVNVGAGAFVLTCQEVALTPAKDQHDNSRRNEQSKSKDGGQGAMFRTKKNELPIQTDTLEDCFHGVDTWISKNVGHFPGILSRFAQWRKLPATESQLKYLRKLGYDHDPINDFGGGEDYGGEARALTKGQAANMITRLVHGAGKRWTESKKFEVKKTKALAKEIGVEVGPIPKFLDI
ncbi:P-loop containing nucleoside triphosphate hydrolase protein [Linnemannia elongata]|nr:P-loop containing nucleoside triphosphate hydrolase protein [Linnemannia elongata]